MKDRIVIKKNIISFDKDVNEIDVYLESILKKVLNTEKDIRILKEKNKSYKLYIDGDYECNFMVEDNVVLYDYMIKIIYKDKTYTFITKEPPMAVLIKKAAKIEKASGKPNREKVATITMAQVEEIAKQKMPDLNAASLEAAMSMVKGTARSMGVVVAD